MKAGVIGYPLAHSVSPQFQQPAFDHLGLDVTYRAYETPPEALGAFVAGLRDEKWLGCNVTIPHKRAIVKLMDTVSEEARLIGAVNTVVKEAGGRLAGHNTDSAGFLRALVEDAGFDPRGKTAVLLGAGGAAPAVAVALLRAGAGRLWIANRTPARAESLARALAAHFDARRLDTSPLDEAALRRPLAEATLLVNSTSVGMAHGPVPDGSPVPAELLGPHLLVYDLVYNPARTPLLQAAATRVARTQEGLPMLIYQGARSFEQWTGQTAPVAIMMEHGRRALAAREGASSGLRVPSSESGPG
ncbi:MAG: shikimate dehydrogenase [Chloroflexota bacterium]